MLKFPSTFKLDLISVFRNALLQLLLDPDGIWMDANSTNDITYRVVQIMLELLKEQDARAAQAWENSVVLLMDNPNIMSKHTLTLVKDACRQK